MNNQATCPECQQGIDLVKIFDESGEDTGKRVNVLEEHLRFDAQKGEMVNCDGPELVTLEWLKPKQNES